MNTKITKKQSENLARDLIKSGFDITGKWSNFGGFDLTNEEISIVLYTLFNSTDRAYQLSNLFKKYEPED